MNATNSTLARKLAATFATALLAAAPLAAHADRYGDPMAPMSAEARQEPSQLTRESVREELKNWQAAGMMPLAGEITETPEVLQQRQTFNELQAEVLISEYQAAEAHLQALAAQPMPDESSAETALL